MVRIASWFAKEFRMAMHPRQWLTFAVQWIVVTVISGVLARWSGFSWPAVLVFVLLAVIIAPPLIARGWELFRGASLPKSGVSQTENGEMLERDNARQERIIFPDVEFESRKTGFRTTDTHASTGAPFPAQIVLFGIRITNHEREKRVSLTFHMELSIDKNGAWRDFGDSIPLAPITPMPIDVAPQSSHGIELEFERGMVPDSALGGGGMIVKVEDHLSGLTTPLPQMGTWRPAKDGDWTGAFPPPRAET